MKRASKFAGGDQTYLREQQYKDSGQLGKRANLHARYRTAEVSWFDWTVAQVDLQQRHQVLEAGCGPGWMWDESSTPIPANLSITLTDLSEGMVAEAISRVEDTGKFASVQGHAADLENLSMAAASYDRVIANHMLYHLPHPAQGVAELARVVAPDGLVVVATNGLNHLQELWSLQAEVFGSPLVDETAEVFGAESGFTILRDHFADVRWLQYEDALRVTESEHVLDYLSSYPPGEDASDEQWDALRCAIDKRFERGNGTMTITKDVGLFQCRLPR